MDVNPLLLNLSLWSITYFCSNNPVGEIHKEITSLTVLSPMNQSRNQISAFIPLEMKAVVDSFV